MSAELPGAAVAVAAEAILQTWIEHTNADVVLADSLGYALARAAIAAVLDDNAAADAIIGARDRQLRDASRFAT